MTVLEPIKPLSVPPLVGEPIPELMAKTDGAGSCGTGIQRGDLCCGVVDGNGLCLTVERERAHLVFEPSGRRTTLSAGIGNYRELGN